MCLRSDPPRIKRLSVYEGQCRPAVTFRVWNLSVIRSISGIEMTKCDLARMENVTFCVQSLRKLTVSPHP